MANKTIPNALPREPIILTASSGLCVPSRITRIESWTRRLRTTASGQARKKTNNVVAAASGTLHGRSAGVRHHDG
jgi:hypothetical protein